MAIISLKMYGLQCLLLRELRLDGGAERIESTLSDLILNKKKEKN